MSMKYRLAYAVAKRLGRRGFEVRRHASARRQAVLEQYGVDLVLDVGAASGGYGTELRAFGYQGQIISFEPQSSAFAELDETVADDPAWSAQQFGLGAEPGEVTINIASNSTSSSILPMLDTHIEAAPHVTFVAEETITIERLDDVVGAQVEAAKAPFLKIDTQGFEREVLAGAPHILESLVGLQLELSLVPLYDGGMLIDEAVSWAYDRGFQLVVIEQGYAAPTGEILQIDGVFVRKPA